MSQHRSRRRFLIDLLCLGGVLGAASQIQPFFGHFLEDQHPDKSPSPAPAAPEPSPSAPPPPQLDVTEAYPSDSDLHTVRNPPGPVTKAYPSDADAHRPDTTCAYPSDSDVHQRRPDPVSPVERKKTSMGPLWTRLS
jgi:hypothetical protein